MLSLKARSFVGAALMLVFLVLSLGIPVLWLWELEQHVTSSSSALSTNNNDSPWLQHNRKPTNTANDDDTIVPPPIQLQLLSTPEFGCTSTADVRGNLGPASVVLNNHTNWLKDRWQAASNMHGKAISGPHWVQLEWKQQQVEIHSLTLDWEAAFADQYDVQVWRNLTTGNQDDREYGNHRSDKNWMTVWTAPRDILRVQTSGHSPGVKDPKVPLHVVHTLAAQQRQPVPTTALRILIRQPSVTGWGVSLWQVQVYGRGVPVADE